jgi:hypothetical protein
MKSKLYRFSQGISRQNLYFDHSQANYKLLVQSNLEIKVRSHLADDGSGLGSSIKTKEHAIITKGVASDE